MKQTAKTIKAETGKIETASPSFVTVKRLYITTMIFGIIFILFLVFGTG